MPGAGHVKPAVQGAQAEGAAPPGAPLRVPGGHGVGAFAPARQNEPAGHGTPVTPPSFGTGEAAPPKQRKPALQRPVGAVRPGEAQKEPGGQAAHSSAEARPVLLLAVPLGQRPSAPGAEPPAQKRPAPQGSGSAQRAPHAKRAGHGAQAAAPASLKEPAGQGCGAAEPAGAKEPAGARASVPLTEPPAHAKPAGQRRAGTTRPKSGQKKPGEQAMQSPAARAPVALRKVPGGHMLGAAERAGQKWPSGHTSPPAATMPAPLKAKAPTTPP